MISKLNAVVIGALTAGLAACGGGGGGGGVSGSTGSATGLQMPSSLSVVAAPAGATNPAPNLNRSIANPLPGSGTDFGTAAQRVYMFDESMESLQTVNMILCLMDQTRASDLVNTGAYIALVNEKKCEQGKNQSSAGTSGQSSTTQTVSYNSWTVLSTRADNTSPQIVKIWVPGDASASDPRDGQNILVEVNITEGVSTAVPFGSFALNFKGVDGPGTATIMKGMLRTANRQGTNKPEFEYLNLQGDSIPGNTGTNFSGEEASYVVFDDATGNSGKARTRSYRNEPQMSAPEDHNYALDYNTSFVHRAKNTGAGVVSACLDRDPATYDTQVWRYNLYTAAGALVSLNSGFPFTYDHDVNTGTPEKYGHIGYWGVWYEGVGSLPDGAVVNKRDYTNNTSTPYTVKLSPGKLIKRTAETATLASMQGVEFNYWGTVNSTNGSFRAVVDSNNKFIATDSVVWGNNGPTLTPLPSGGPGYQSAPVAGYDITPTTSGQTLWLWSDALGGNVTYVQAATNVTFYRQEFVTPGTSGLPATVNCYTQCPKGGLPSAPATSAELYHPEPGSTPYAYAIDTSTTGKIVVRDHLGAAVDFSTIDLTSLGNSWGISTSEMITGTVTNPWDVYNLPSGSVSYRWESGLNNWNRMVAVIDSNNAVMNFDKPLQFTYAFDPVDERNSNPANIPTGAKFMLQYGGPGELWGFPWKQDGNRWYSTLTLNDGVELSNGAGYLVKAIEMEKRMKVTTAAGSCTGLDSTAVLGDSSYALPVPASMGAVSFTWASRPTPANSAPAVIGGVLQ